jgi:hypothetical protein
MEYIKHASISLGTNKAKGRTIRRIDATNIEGETEIVRRGEHTMAVCN